MLTILAFIVTLGLLVVVHEYGHFQVAKWCGVKVLKFSIGFGKPLFSKKIGLDQTEFVIAAIPLGGFVKMLDERELSRDELSSTAYSELELKRAFNRQSVTKRIAIVLAGPMANLLLAILLYWLLFMTGVVGMKPTLGKVLYPSPAATANFSSGETIQKINGKDVSTWQEVSWALLNESLKHTSVQVQVISADQEVRTHQLSLSAINIDDVRHDVLTLLGLTVNQPSIPARIGEVLTASPADFAGLKTNDLVLSVAGIKVKDWQDFVEVIKQHANQPLDVLVLRNAAEVKLTVRPKPELEQGITVGRIGAGLQVAKSQLDDFFITVHYSATDALMKAIVKTWDTAIFSLKILGKMLAGQASWKGMSGPVTIANYAGQSASMGIKVFIGFLALISISIGMLNLLPIPVLDGGYLMYYMVEILTGKPVPESVMVIGQKIGFSMLGFMMVIAFYNDINRWIVG